MFRFCSHPSAATLNSPIQLVIHTTKCRVSGETASVLICGKREELSFLSFLINTHQYGRVEEARSQGQYPHIHQDLRLKWDPEVLYDIELRNRITSAASVAITGGPSTFVMVPLVEMKLDRTKIITQESSYGVSEFLTMYFEASLTGLKNFDVTIDVIPSEYSDFLEAFLGLERSDDAH